MFSFVFVYILVPWSIIIAQNWYYDKIDIIGYKCYTILSTTKILVADKILQRRRKMDSLFSVIARIRLVSGLAKRLGTFSVCEEGFLKDDASFSDEDMLNFLIECGVNAGSIIFCLTVPVAREEEYVNARLAAMEAPSA